MRIASWLLGERDVHIIYCLLVQGDIYIYLHIASWLLGERDVHIICCLLVQGDIYIYICTLPVGCWGREMCTSLSPSSQQAMCIYIYICLLAPANNKLCAHLSPPAAK